MQVHEADELPKMICEHCLYKLELFYDFRERAVRTEAVLIDLFKELNSARVQNEQQMVKISQPMDVVSTMNHPDMIMVQHPHLLTEHSIHSVNELDLSHLEHRENMIVEHEIILAHQNVDMNSHSLDAIDLNHHELSQDLSNHSLQTQEMLVNTTNNVHGIQNTRYTEDLMHQQQQLLDEQYRLQHELHVGLPENRVSVRLSNAQNSTDIVPEENKTLNRIDENVPKTETSTNRSCTSPCNEHSQNEVIGPHEPDITKCEYSINGCKQEDSNDGSKLLRDDSRTSEQQDFLLLSDKMIVSESEGRDWFYCSLCGKTFEQKVEFDVHYEQHFVKCNVCSAMFINEEALSQHQKTHESPAQEPKVNNNNILTRISFERALL